jgi:hypothetical protein
LRPALWCGVAQPNAGVVSMEVPRIPRAPLIKTTGYQPPQGAEVLLPFPPRIMPVRHVRSTVLLASIEGVRQAGRLEDYRRLVPVAHHQALFESVAGSWLPVEAGRAHYLACDQLGIPTIQQVQMGARTAERTGESMVGTVMRLAKQAGATPVLYFTQFQRLWARAYDGGAIAVYKTGPKDARLDVISFSLCESPFYRNALRGWVQGLAALFSTRVYLREAPQPDGADSVAYVAQWV